MGLYRLNLKHFRPNLLKPFQLVMAKIGVDLKIFQILKESEDPVTVSQLAEKSGAAPGLLGRKSIHHCV